MLVYGQSMVSVGGVSLGLRLWAFYKLMVTCNSGDFQKLNFNFHPKWYEDHTKIVTNLVTRFTTNALNFHLQLALLQTTDNCRFRV